MASRKPTRHETERARLLEHGTRDHYEDPALYDYEYSDRMEDIAWYRRLARERAGDGPLLELGVGTGRIAIPLASDGHRIIGVDRMEPMLAVLRERAVRRELTDRIDARTGEMTALPVDDDSVALAIAPFNTLMHLYTWRDLLQCFCEVHRVLRRGGLFAFDVELPDLEWLRWDPERRHAVTRFSHPKTGERLVYSTNHTYDAATQICHVRIFYDDAPPAGHKFKPPPTPRRLVHLAHRQIFPEEVRCLVAQAGLELESHTADFLDIALRSGVSSQVVVAAKP